jgi:ABC-type bacteriocin/lantibiotic exporter with double-glycine peptidase domain
MPMHLLPIEYQVQEEEFGCLAACAQMVLGAAGLTVSQNELNRLLNLRTGGVPYSRLQRLTKYKVNISLAPGDESQLRHALDQGIAPIIFVHTSQLTSYWTVPTRHAVVVVGYDDLHFYLNDPAFPDAPKQVPIDELMLAWLEFDYMYALITR